MSTFQLKVKKLRNSAVLPTRTHATDAGVDLYCCDSVTINPGQLVKIGTGIAYEIPEGHVGLVWDKSSIGGKGLKTFGGVVDAGYRGELFVVIQNLSEVSYAFEAGHKIAQMLVQKIELPDIVEVEELSDTARGEGAFGSTGK